MNKYLDHFQFTSFMQELRKANAEVLSQPDEVVSLSEEFSMPSRYDILMSDLLEKYFGKAIDSITQKVDAGATLSDDLSDKLKEEYDDGYEQGWDDCTDEMQDSLSSARYRNANSRKRK